MLDSGLLLCTFAVGRGPGSITVCQGYLLESNITSATFWMIDIGELSQSDILTVFEIFLEKKSNLRFPGKLLISNKT